MKLDTDFTFHKINSNWITDRNVNCKLLDNNIGENLDNLGYSDDFFGYKPKAESMKERIKLGSL